MVQNHADPTSRMGKLSNQTLHANSISKPFQTCCFLQPMLFDKAQLLSPYIPCRVYLWFFCLLLKFGTIFYWIIRKTTHWPCPSWLYSFQTCRSCIPCFCQCTKLSTCNPCLINWGLLCAPALSDQKMVQTYMPGGKRFGFGRRLAHWQVYTEKK